MHTFRTARADHRQLEARGCVDERCVKRAAGVAVADERRVNHVKAPGSVSLLPRNVLFKRRGDIDTSLMKHARRPRRIRLLGPCLLLLFVHGGASDAIAQWTSLGDMPAPSRIDNGLVYRSAQGIVSVTASAPDILRVRFSPTRDFGRDHSYAIVNRDLGAPGAAVNIGDRL